MYHASNFNGQEVSKADLRLNLKEGRDGGQWKAVQIVHDPANQCKSSRGSLAVSDLLITGLADSARKPSVLHSRGKLSNGMTFQTTVSVDDDNLIGNQVGGRVFIGILFIDMIPNCCCF
jgi:hypothetical protein